MERLKKTVNDAAVTIAYKCDTITEDKDMIDFLKRINEGGRVKIEKVGFIDVVSIFEKKSFELPLEEAMDCIEKLNDCHIGMIGVTTQLDDAEVGIMIDTVTYMVMVAVPGGNKKLIGKMEQIIRSADK